MTPLDAALQRALAAEQRACFGYALLGPWLAAGDRPRARTDAAAHSALRDATAGALVSAGLDAPPPAANYPDVPAVTDAGAAGRLAVRIEDGCAAAWRFVYLEAASTTGARAGSARTTAQANLTASAVRAARWRQRVTPEQPAPAFPGL